MIRPLSLLLLSSLLGGCAGSGQNALLGDVLSRAMQETSLSSADQGLVVKAVQVATQGGQRHDAGHADGSSAEPTSQPSAGDQPAAEDAEAW